MLEFWTGAEELPLWGFMVRAIIVYVYIFVMIKVLGQRSIGTIHPLDFLFGVIIGDVLGEPLSDGNIPMSGPFAAAALIASLHLFLSYVALKAPVFRRVIEDEPIILIEKGKILAEQLKRTKITAESLMMDLRLNSTPYLNQIDYAVLESNGRISVIQKQDFQPLTPNDMAVPPAGSSGYPSVLILDGTIVDKNVRKFGTEAWVREQITRHGVQRPKDVFLMTIDESGQIYVARKNTQKKR